MYMEEGRKRFLGIGNNEYREHPELSGVAGDMRAIARVLAGYYGFGIERSDLYCRSESQGGGGDFPHPAGNGEVAAGMDWLNGAPSGATTTRKTELYAL
jgi:hypothetical protein